MSVKHYDNIIKPEISAPGNKIVSAQSPNNLLVKRILLLDANVSGKERRAKRCTLSGTSMATPMVAGAAALLLQLNPQLTPNMVKATLMYSAQQLRGFNMLEQGAGELNIDGAVRLSRDWLRTKLWYHQTCRGSFPEYDNSADAPDHDRRAHVHLVARHSAWPALGERHRLD